MAGTEGLSAGQTALSEVSAAFAALDPVDVQVPPLLHASVEMLKLYDLMFPKKGSIYEMLKKVCAPPPCGGRSRPTQALRLRAQHACSPARAACAHARGVLSPLSSQDHEGHIKGLRKLYEADKVEGHASGDSLFPLLERELAKRGMASVRGDLGSGVCSTLWLMRTFAFLIRFLENLCNPATRKDEAYDCARAAYKEVLFPYHRVMVSMVVRLALGTSWASGRRVSGPPRLPTWRCQPGEWRSGAPGGALADADFVSTSTSPAQALWARARIFAKTFRCHPLMPRTST